MRRPLPDFPFSHRAISIGLLTAHWPRIAEPGWQQAEETIRAACAVASDLRNQERPFSPAEAELLAAFWVFGYKPRLQVPVGPYDADFALGDLLIEVDGAEWHRDHARAARRDEFLASHGFRVFHLEARDVYRSPILAAASAIARAVPDPHACALCDTTTTSDSLIAHMVYGHWDERVFLDERAIAAMTDLDDEQLPSDDPA